MRRSWIPAALAHAIIARTALEPHAIAVLASDDAKAIVLDFVQPSLARWRLLGFGWKAGRDEASGQSHIHTAGQLSNDNGPDKHRLKGMCPLVEHSSPD